YTVKLLQYNITSQWDGTVGNTSPNHNNMVYHNEGEFISRMSITAAGEMYYTTGYNERWPVCNYTTTANPQVMNYPLHVAFRSSYNDQFHVCTDGTIVYYNWNAGTSSGTYGVKCSDKSLVTFSSGIVFGGADFQQSMIITRTGAQAIFMTG